MVDRSLIWIGPRLVIRFMRFHGTYPARDFLREACTPAERARFLALATTLAELGHLADGSDGHPLKGRYAGLYELKPLGKRFFGFFVGRTLYITNAAPKRKPKEQALDYDRARLLCDDFYARIKRGDTE